MITSFCDSQSYYDQKLSNHYKENKMSKQNPTVEDSEEYKRLKIRYKDTHKRLFIAEDLIKQFHYGPVTEEYKARVKRYIEEEGL